MTKILLILLVTVCIDGVLCQITTGTTIIIFSSPDSLIVASDSKMVFQKKDEEGNKYIIKEKEKSTCKIRLGINFGIATAGFVSDLKGNSVADLVDSVCYYVSNIPEAISSFQNNIDRVLTKTISDNYISDTLIVEYAIFGFENDKPIIFNRSVWCCSINGDVRIHHSPVLPGSNAPYRLLHLGEYKKVFEELEKISWNFNSSSSFVEVVEKMMEIAIEKYPDIVGAPVNILVATKNGFQWVYNNGCQ